MDSVGRTALIYLVLLILFRVTGKRSISQITTFDFILLLIIGEATQNALLSDDYSVTNAIVVILTLLGVDILLSLIKSKSRRLERWLEGLPLILVEDGKPFKERLTKARVDEADILAAARELQGLQRMDQIKYAVLERSGGISIVPKRDGP